MNKDKSSKKDSANSSGAGKSSAPSAAAAANTGPRPPVAKGHKQRGAGTVIVAKAPVVTADGIVLKVSWFLLTHPQQAHQIDLVIVTVIVG